MATRPDAVSRLLRELCAHDRGWDVALRPPLLRGDVVGRFEVVRVIGRGGFGIVYEARDRELGGRVALKMLRLRARRGPEREALQSEVDAGRLRHPNIAAFLEAGSCERGPYAVFEYLSGETVRERLTRGPLPLEDMIEVAAAVARALACAHSHGVVHRDVKPANVFLPVGSEPKLIDFGLASLAGATAPRGSGTRRYMSPEQQRGEPEDARTDLFALGLLICEMATGTRVGDDEAVSPSLGSLPHSLRALVADLVQPDPSRRPGSAEEVLARLGTIERTLARRTPPVVPGPLGPLHSWCGLALGSEF